MSALESAKIVGITEEKINFGTVETLASELQSYAYFCWVKFWPQPNSFG